jgi:hypothetical protein
MPHRPSLTTPRGPDGPGRAAPGSVAPGHGRAGAEPRSHGAAEGARPWREHGRGHPAPDGLGIRVPRNAARFGRPGATAQHRPASTSTSTFRGTCSSPRPATYRATRRPSASAPRIPRNTFSTNSRGRELRAAAAPQHGRGGTRRRTASTSASRGTHRASGSQVPPPATRHRTASPAASRGTRSPPHTTDSRTGSTAMAGYPTATASPSASRGTHSPPPAATGPPHPRPAEHLTATPLSTSHAGWIYSALQPVHRLGVITSTTPSGGAAAYWAYFATSSRSARSRNAPSVWTAAVPSIRTHHSAVQSSA